MSDGIVPLTPAQQAVQEAQTAHEGFLKRDLIALDQFANVLTGGHPDETISARLARDAEEGHLIGVLGSKALDIAEADHGAKAQAGDVERAKSVEVLEENSPGLGK